MHDFVKQVKPTPLIFPYLVFYITLKQEDIPVILYGILFLRHFLKT